MSPTGVGPTGHGPRAAASAFRACRPKSADDGVEKTERLAGLVLEQPGRRCTGRRLAAVERRHRAGASVVPDEKRATSETRGLGFDKAENGLDSDYGVGGRATPFQNAGAGLDRVRLAAATIQL